MDLLEQSGEIIILVGAWLTHRPIRERTAKCGGDPGLVVQILNLDDSTFHWDFACGVLFDLN
ncbi:MAG: hypothetical protein V4696_01025 [Pseudomonadota bacterium]